MTEETIQEVTTRKIEVVVAEKSNDVGEALKKLIQETDKALDDGFQADQDIPAVLLTSYQDVIKAVAAFKSLGGEFKAEPVKATMGMLVPISEGVETLIKK